MLVNLNGKPLICRLRLYCYQRGLLESNGAWAVYNVADKHPAGTDEIICFMAEQLNLPHQKKVLYYNAISTGALSAKMVEFYQGRKLMAAKALESLEWQPKHPSYKDGYPELIKQNDGPQY